MDEEQRKLAEELLFSEKKQPSFAKQLYFGQFESQNVLPFPAKISEDEEAYLERIQDFIFSEVDPDSIDRQAEIPSSVIKGMGEIGMLGMTVPKEHGGLGMSQRVYCKTAEMLAGRCASTALFLNAHQSIGLKALLLFGTDEQKQRWLPGMARGEMLGAFALTEPSAGSDAAGIKTRAVYDPEANVYRITGEKQWITNGSMADVLTVMAKTEVDTKQGKQEKVTAFLVTPDMEGFRIKEKALEKVGMRGTRTSNLEFRDVAVPVNQILGPLGGGLRVCLTVLDYGRTTFGATCTGTAKFCVEKAIAHAKKRIQFNRPLAGFELVKKKIATMSAMAYAMEASTYLTAGLVDEHIEDIMLEAAILKVFASESIWDILYDTMQIYGGRSFFTDHPFERMMRDARLNMIGEGSNEVMRAFIGLVGMRDVGMLLKATSDAASSPLKNFSTLAHFSGHIFGRLFAPSIPIQSKEIQIEAKLLGKAIRRFGIEVLRLLGRYREDIIERQLILDRMATCAIAFYTMTAVLGKLDQDLQSGTCSSNDLESGKLYCKIAFQRIHNSFGSLRSNLDREMVSLSDQITGIITT